MMLLLSKVNFVDVVNNGVAAVNDDDGDGDVVDADDDKPVDPEGEVGHVAPNLLLTTGKALTAGMSQ